MLLLPFHLLLQALVRVLGRMLCSSSYGDEWEHIPPYPSSPLSQHSLMFHVCNSRQQLDDKGPVQGRQFSTGDAV